MSHKLYGFAHSLNPILIQYVEEQLSAMLKYDPELEIELGNENNEVLLRYSTTPDRFPCFMLIKNNSCKNYVHAKLSNTDMLTWYITKRG